VEVEALIRELPRMAKAATNPDLRTAIEAHL
jgi:ferritin-like metal-binding protein YciE